MDSRLVRLVEQAKAGHRREALLALRAYLQARPDDAEAWVVLAGLAPEPKIALAALRHALELDPQHTVARRMLAAVQARQQPQPATRPASPSSEERRPAAPPAPPPPPEARPTAHAPRPTPAASPDGRVLREARAIPWPFLPRREKSRTLGELLDEGRITRQDLEWAAEQAREAHIREAAQVVLERVHHLPDVGMSVGQARLIAWPYRRLNRPLGELVEAELVRVKDLRRAAWFAKDARLREAARLMLPLAERKREVRQHRKRRQRMVRRFAGRALPLRKEAQPPQDEAHPASPAPEEKEARPSARRMPIIQGANYLADQIQQRYRGQLRLMGAGLLLLLGGLGGVLFILVRGIGTAPLWAYPLPLVMLLPIFWLADRMVELWQEEQSFRRGQQGEIKVARRLRQRLGGDWTLFRNVQLPGGRGDIDMVLLGPAGLFALEVKAYAGRYRYRRWRWYRRGVTGWRWMHHNPGKQVRANARRLEAYVEEALGRDFRVEPRLVWVGPGSLRLEHPEVRVWFLERLHDEAERLATLPTVLSAEDRALLSGLLRGLCSTLSH